MSILPHPNVAFKPTDYISVKSKINETVIYHFSSIQNMNSLRSVQCLDVHSNHWVIQNFRFPMNSSFSTMIMIQLWDGCEILKSSLHLSILHIRFLLLYLNSSQSSAYSRIIKRKRSRRGRKRSLRLLYYKDWIHCICYFWRVCLKSFNDGTSSSFLGNCFKCLTALRLKKVFLLPNQKVLHSNINSLFHVLSLVSIENRFCSSLCQLFTYLKVVISSLDWRNSVLSCCTQVMFCRPVVRLTALLWTILEGNVLN